MDIKMLFEFPGILILVGIILLILSIIIGLTAYKKVDKEDLVFSLNDEDNGVVADPSVISEVTIVDEPNEVTKDIPVLEDKETEIDEPTIIDEEIETPILDDINIYGGNNPKTNIKVKKFKEESYKKDIPAEEIEVL